MFQPTAFLRANHSPPNGLAGIPAQDNPDRFGRLRRTTARRRILRDLHRAIERDELVVHYQPVWDLLSGEVRGAEALVRWRHPVHGLLRPDGFINMAEQSGFISELGAWVLNQACAEAVTWQQPERPISVAVNLSPRQFDLQAVDELVHDALTTTGLAPQCLDLELTESTALADLAEATISLGRLRELGVRCSIDDFGTGYSALSYLSALPVTGVKIDRSFVMTLNQNDASAPIVQAVVAIAGDLNLAVIAEGVEHPDQLKFIQASGCEQAQGFLLGRPMTPTGIHSLIEANRPQPTESRLIA